MASSTTVAIIGAGPYGLSVATNLRARGVDFRIFGRPMYAWRQQMPKGMFLKSEGFASSFSDPDHRYTLPAFCAIITGNTYFNPRNTPRTFTATRIPSEPRPPRRNRSSSSRVHTRNRCTAST